MKRVQNFHLFVITILPYTQTLPKRIKITSFRFNQSIVVRLDDDVETNFDQAVKTLNNKGFNLIGQAEGKDCFYLMSDTFKPLK